MQKNDIIDLVIEDMGVDGEGIGKYEGMTFFVKDAIIGDSIKARVTKVKKNYGYARVEEIIIPSQFRVEPQCELYRRCGGCQIQAMDYRRQLEFKQNKVRGNLIRIGGFESDFIDSVMFPAVGMAEPYRYRNKAQFPVGRDKDGRLCAGFYAARTHSIIPVSDCKLGVTQNEEVLDCVLAYMEENHVDAYDEATGKGLVRHVLIRYGFTTKEIMVCLVINGKKLPAQGKLIEKLCRLDGMTSISLNRNMKNTNVILGDETECIWGQPYITDYIHLWECKEKEKKRVDASQAVSGCEAVEQAQTEREAGPEFVRTDTAVAYHISPQSFYQVNPVQTEKLYSLALDYAELTGKETVWDLYCGIGTISLFLAQRAAKVYGVEVVPQAVRDARGNAKLNGISNVEFFVGKAEEVLPEFYERVGESNPHERDAGMLHPHVIVVDPPRKGCDEKCLATMLKMRPDRIVYVSCDSATLARDLRVLCDGGYEIRKVRAVGQFGQTTHVETVVQLSQQKADDHIEVELDLDELDVTSVETKATYKKIHDYVLEKIGLNVTNLNIAQVKDKLGMDKRKNYNLPKSDDARKPKCLEVKEKAIEDALRYFQMIV